MADYDPKRPRRRPENGDGPAQVDGLIDLAAVEQPISPPAESAPPTAPQSAPPAAPQSPLTGASPSSENAVTAPVDPEPARDERTGSQGATVSQPASGATAPSASGATAPTASGATAPTASGSGGQRSQKLALLAGALVAAVLVVVLVRRRRT